MPHNSQISSQPSPQSLHKQDKGNPHPRSSSHSNSSDLHRQRKALRRTWSSHFPLLHRQSNRPPPLRLPRHRTNSSSRRNRGTSSTRSAAIGMQLASPFLRRWPAGRRDRQPEVAVRPIRSGAAAREGVPTAIWNWNPTDRIELKGLPFSSCSSSSGFLSLSLSSSSSSSSPLGWCFWRRLGLEGGD